MYATDYVIGVFLRNFAAIYCPEQLLSYASDHQFTIFIHHDVGIICRYIMLRWEQETISPSWHRMIVMTFFNLVTIHTHNHYNYSMLAG